MFTCACLEASQTHRKEDASDSGTGIRTMCSLLWFALHRVVDFKASIPAKIMAIVVAHLESEDEAHHAKHEQRDVRRGHSVTCCM